MSYSKYIGLPFEEKGRGPAFDCWGLVIHVLKQEHDISGLPDFTADYESTTDKFNIPLLTYQERQNWREVRDPKEGDVVLLNIAGRPLHVGVMIDSGKFLHVTKGINSCIERIHGSVWQNRIEGFYRYE